jgi:hypothetical protein
LEDAVSSHHYHMQHRLDQQSVIIFWEGYTTNPINVCMWKALPCLVCLDRIEENLLMCRITDCSARKESIYESYC